MCQELLTTWSMTFSLHWHHIFSAISLHSWEEGNEETKLIVMKYRALWVTALGRLSPPACSQKMHFIRPLDWTQLWISVLLSSKSMSSFFSFSLRGTVSHDWILFFFIRTLKEWLRSSESLNIIDVLFACIVNSLLAPLNFSVHAEFKSVVFVLA